MLEKLKKSILIIIAIIIFIIIMISYILIKNSNYEDDSKTNSMDDDIVAEGDSEIIKNIEEVCDKNKYYAVEKILNTYIQYIKQTKGIIDFQKYDDNEIEEEGIRKVYDILDRQYISEMGITKEDLSSKIKEYEDYKLVIEKMYLYPITHSLDLYFVYGKIDDNNIQMLIKIDTNNTTFSIFLEDYIEKKNYQIDMLTENIDITNEEIKNNNNNMYRYVEITDEYMAKQYFNSLKDNLINNMQYTYTNLMEEEYRNKKFENIENFKEFINKNKEELSNIKLEKYTINSTDNGIEYVCLDNNQNYYVFKEKAIMNYTFKFDTYTIPTEKFVKEYQTAKVQNKVMMNVDKWVQMLNTRDYTAAYKVLNQTYRNNTFGNEEQFEDRMREMLPSYYEIQYDKFSEEGKTYLLDIILTDIMNENEIPITIFMQLNDDLDFVMSFSIE
ncbi:MAG: hypothetical protein HFJ35_03910 [Clostridia bacterium]|nr:hypothetical protein [Clostridia bacterium]